MGDMIRDGVSWLTDQLKANASQTVSYKQGTVTVSVQATITQTLLKLDEDHDQRMVMTDATFLIKTSDLTAAFAAQSATFTTPKRGDEVIAPFPEGNRKYQVLAPGNEPHWRWSDEAGHTQMMIYGTYVGNA